MVDLELASAHSFTHGTASGKRMNTGGETSRAKRMHLDVPSESDEPSLNKLDIIASRQSKQEEGSVERTAPTRKAAHDPEVSTSKEASGSDKARFEEGHASIERLGEQEDDRRDQDATLDIEG